MLRKYRMAIALSTFCFLVLYVLIDLPALKRQMLISFGVSATVTAFGFEQEKSLRERNFDWHVKANLILEDGRAVVTNVSMASEEYLAIKSAVARKQQAERDLGNRLSGLLGQEVSTRVVVQESLLVGEGGARFPIRFRPETPEISAYDYQSFLDHSKIFVLLLVVGFLSVIYCIVLVVQRKQSLI